VVQPRGETQKTSTLAIYVYIFTTIPPVTS